MGAELNTIILGVTALVTAATPIMLALINRRQKVAATFTAEKVEQVRTDLRAQSDTANRHLDEIHTAVNSERTALIEKVDALHGEVVRLTALLARKEGTTQA